jgi:hypothetical protein
MENKTERKTNQTLSLLQDLSGKYGMSKVFSDFLELSVAAFGCGNLEDDYFKSIKGYSKDELLIFNEAFGSLVLDYEESVLSEGSWKDCIGNLYEEIGMSNPRTGQFFTPESICNLMAELVIDEEDSRTVNDPSAGSSRNLVAHSRLNPKNRFKYTYYAQDLDFRCVLMSVLNFVFHGLSGYIVHQNTLSLETFSGYKVYLPETGLGVRKMTESELNQFK